MLHKNVLSTERTIAYFSMEIGIEAEMPTYSGGLGVLAGDTIRSAADLNIPMVAVTLLHRKGYFFQRINDEGLQSEEPEAWVVEDFLRDTQKVVTANIEGREVKIRAWEFEVKGTGGFTVPIYFLDTDLPENSEWDRTLTHYLYGGDKYYRLCQEIVLGIGGIRILKALGHHQIQRFHMNEGHAAFLTLELLDEQARRCGRNMVSRGDFEAVKQKCIFTTHTPVPAGHDQFPTEMVRRVLGPRDDFLDMKDVFCLDLAARVLGLTDLPGDLNITTEAKLNMTLLALNMSHYVNGVAKKHGEISRRMFAEYDINSITNGVHAATWTGASLRDLYDEFIPSWRNDNFSLRYALNIPKEKIWAAHMEQKRQLIEYVNQKNNLGMSKDVLTIGFARRSASYKRGDLFFSNIERLKEISTQSGPFQVIYAGKAHPHDQNGKEIIKRIYQAIEFLKKDVKVAYLENYDMSLGKMITSGVDLWLNTPQPPMEASGTSGMKAALNGIPSLSILDGWWIEGCLEGVTGWSIKGNADKSDLGGKMSNDARSLYRKLEEIIIPLFYQERDRFIDIMRHCIAINGSFFNTHRMVQQYVLNAYFL
jgi:glycogen phosphorylase